VIEKVDRLESENERRIAMLLKQRCSEQCGFETVSGSRSHYTAKSTHRVAGWFSIIWQVVQPPLHREWCTQFVDEASFRCFERQARWIDLRCIGKSHS
jgi:hypothetical protein